jgi:hypothetical protein
MGTGAGAGAAGGAAAAAASWAMAGAAKPIRPAKLTVPKNNFVKFFIYQVPLVVRRIVPILALCPGSR